MFKKVILLNESLCKDPIICTTRGNNQDAFSYFYLYLEVSCDQCKNLCDLCNIWDNYMNSITCKVQYSHCFKYLYHEIKTVLSQSDHVLKAKNKRYYIGIIQSYLNYDELFCYLINLIQHYHRVGIKDNEEDNEFKKALLNYNFFGDLEHEDKYWNVLSGLKAKSKDIDDALSQLINFFKNMIEDFTICISIINNFYTHVRGTNLFGQENNTSFDGTNIVIGTTSYLGFSFVTRVDK